ncbi:very short patch repair protein [mine drainage metagenome]|uniref:Very short patch repair protein n=1 Tax=mine drainage metagenome TaxID=410659 RepID=A0A1J5S5N2_9ZZZZ
MTDIVDTKTRSRMMASIRSKDTKPEMLVRRFLHSSGFRFRLHDKKLSGSPDIVLAKYRLAIFVHGCFWHRHAGCRFATTPAQNRRKWIHKFNQNMARDKRQIQFLVNNGWRVLVIWECGLNSAIMDLQWLPEFVKSNGEFYTEWPK